MFDAWKQRQRQRLENRPERTVFYNIFATMMLVLAVELLMAVASILAINVTEQLDENAKDLLTMRVRNRASYVQEILRNAEDLEQLSEQITATTQQLLKSGDISLDTLDNGSEQSDALLVALAPQLLDTLRTKQVTGIFLILNTHDLDTCEVGKKMPGIYLRDMDPDARPSERNSDLLLERASATVVKELAIGTDKGWQPAFPYQGDTKGGILRTVFQTAYKRRCRPFGGKLWPLDHQLLLSGRGRPARHCLLDAADPAGRHGIRRGGRGTAHGLSADKAALHRAGRGQGRHLFYRDHYR